MDHLNEKYNLDYYSSSEYDSNFELEHKYEMLNINILLFLTKSRRLVSESYIEFAVND